MQIMLFWLSLFWFRIFQDKKSIDRWSKDIDQGSRNARLLCLLLIKEVLFARILAIDNYLSNADMLVLKKSLSNRVRECP